jgi:hypothetical protein
MSTIDFYDRINHWAAWEISFSQNKQGWPRESPLARYQREGFLVNDNLSRSSSIPYYYEEAEQVNNCFNRMKEEHREQAEVFYAFYVHNIRAKVFAKLLNISVRTYYLRLGKAKKWMADELGYSLE